MPVQGSLRSMALPDLLQWLGNALKTGTLEVEHNKICKRIVFRKGRVIACGSDDPPERLGHFLLSRGRITEVMLREALRRQEVVGQHLGAILVEMDAITPEELKRQLSAKAEETIHSLFDWEDAEFRFHDDVVPERNIYPVSLRVDDILLKGLTRYDEMRRIRAVFHDPEIVLRRTSLAPPVALTRNRMALRIFDLVNGQRSVAEILLHAHSSEYLVTKFLFELFRNGLMDIHQVRPARSPDAPPADPAALLEPSPAAPEPPAEAGARSVEQLTADARACLSEGNHDAALDRLYAAYRTRPGDEALRGLIAETEAAFLESTYRQDLPPDRIPVLVHPPETLTGEDLSPTEFFLLSRIDGAWDLKSIVQISPLREVDVVRTLKRMRDKGVIELREVS
jgi:hypothetical protein